MRRARKFLIDEEGSLLYERLINSPFVEVEKEEHFTHFDNFYVMVWYEDNGQDPFGSGNSEDEKGEDDDYYEPADSG